MAPSMARAGRRRRVLNEELLSGVAFNVTGTLPEDVAEHSKPRYGEQACLENHPLISDFVPRRKRIILLVLLAGVAAAAVAETLIQFAEPLAAVVPGLAPDELIEQLVRGGVAWTTTVVLLATAALCRLIHSLRRHRVDDLQGRYRVWRWAALASLLASMNSMAGVHDTLASIARATAGWSLTASGAEWWLAPLALVGAWLFVRIAMEMRESRGALAMLIMAAPCFTVAAAVALGLRPAVLGPWSDALARVLPLVGHALVLASVLTFARYVLLDVQGLVDHTPRPAKPTRPRKQPAESSDAQSPAAPPAIQSIPMTPAAARPAAAAPAAAAAPSKSATAKLAVDSQHDWDDAEEEDEHGYPSRKLSKAEKRRLRKQNRAA